MLRPACPRKCSGPSLCETVDDQLPNPPEDSLVYAIVEPLMMILPIAGGLICSREKTASDTRRAPPFAGRHHPYPLSDYRKIPPAALTLARCGRLRCFNTMPNP